MRVKRTGDSAAISPVISAIRPATDAGEEITVYSMQTAVSRFLVTAFPANSKVTVTTKSAIAQIASILNFVSLTCTFSNEPKNSVTANTITNTGAKSPMAAALPIRLPLSIL